MGKGGGAGRKGVGSSSRGGGRWSIDFILLHHSLRQLGPIVGRTLEEGDSREEGGGGSGPRTLEEERGGEVRVVGVVRGRLVIGGIASDRWRDRWRGRGRLLIMARHRMQHVFIVHM